MPAFRWKEKLLSLAASLLNVRSFVTRTCCTFVAHRETQRGILFGAVQHGQTCCIPVQTCRWFACCHFTECFALTLLPAVSTFCVLNSSISSCLAQFIPVFHRPCSRWERHCCCIIAFLSAEAITRMECLRLFVFILLLQSRLMDIG